MAVEQEIASYFASLPTAKRDDMQRLHDRIRGLLPSATLWFLDGKDATGKTVSNPSIGYGQQQLTYADGSSKPFYQVGISANSSGLTIYIMGLSDREYLPATYADTIGKATVTAYCIKCKKVSDMHLDVLDAAIRDGVAQTSA